MVAHGVGVGMWIGVKVIVSSQASRRRRKRSNGVPIVDDCGTGKCDDCCSTNNERAITALPKHRSVFVRLDLVQLVDRVQVFE